MTAELTLTQIDVIQKSFQRIITDFSNFADDFYIRLFAYKPEYRELFKGDMAVQGTKLMHTLVFVVNSLQTMQDIVPSVQMLGRNHAEYGVQDEDYAIVGKVLIDTLSDKLGSDFGHYEREAWEAAYGLLSSIAIEAANDPGTIS